jgi:hypothetical protein
MGTRSNLFFRASEYRDYVLNTNTTFTGLGSDDTGRDPPDTMGAIGPNHFVELLNGGTDATAAIAVYDKLGHLIQETNTVNFFALTVGGTNYPTGYIMADTRIVYDSQAQRWVASAFDGRGSGQVILAVSLTDSPTNLITGWSRYLVDVSRNGLADDFPTLGLDANGLYLTILQRGADNNLYTNAGQTVVAIKKPEIYNGMYIAHRFDITNGLPIWVTQAAVNFDDVATNG